MAKKIVGGRQTIDNPILEPANKNYLALCYQIFSGPK
jgi:hypothetical protein